MSSTLAQLTALITLILECPAGLNILTGKIEPPTPEELYQIVESCKHPLDVLGVKINGGNSSLPLAEKMIMLADRFEGIVERFGGWEHIVGVVREWVEMNATWWNVIVDHHRWVKGNQCRIGGSLSERIAARHGISKETICRLVKLFPVNLAEAVIRAPIEHWKAV